MADNVILPLLILIAAVLYSSVGHAGASGYLAAMALLGLPQPVMRPAALVLNILVALIATIRFGRAGCFVWRVFAPLAIASIPMAYVGGAIVLPTTIYNRLVGLVLLYAALRLFQHAAAGSHLATRSLSPAVALPLGAGIGLLSGLTGVGGGIFLSPLLLLMRWADARHTAGISAAFILVNSVAGLAGKLDSLQNLPRGAVLWAAAAVLGGAIGSQVGARRLAGPTIRRVLAIVLVIAGLKMILV